MSELHLYNPSSSVCSQQSDDRSRMLRRNDDMTGKVTVDPTDEALLRLLRADARRATADLARALGLSRTTVQSRLERLERSGVIAGYTVRLSPEAAGALIRAHVLVTILPKFAAKAETALRKIPQITALYSVSGPHGSVEQMDFLIDEIGALDGIERTVSSIILSTKFDR